MKRVFSVMLVFGLAAAWIGCQSETEPTAPTVESGPSDVPLPETADSGPSESATAQTADSGPGDSKTSEFTLVSLKVPNMT